MSTGSSLTWLTSRAIAATRDTSVQSHPNVATSKHFRRFYQVHLPYDWQSAIAAILSGGPLKWEGQMGPFVKSFNLLSLSFLLLTHSGLPPPGLRIFAFLLTKLEMFMNVFVSNLKGANSLCNEPCCSWIFLGCLPNAMTAFSAASALSTRLMQAFISLVAELILCAFLLKGLEQNIKIVSKSPQSSSNKLYKYRIAHWHWLLQYWSFWRSMVSRTSRIWWHL